MRANINQDPRQKPKRSIASMAYCEQVGIKRHSRPIHGDRTYWYNRMAPINAFENIAILF